MLWLEGRAVGIGRGGDYRVPTQLSPSLPSASASAHTRTAHTHTPLLTSLTLALNAGQVTMHGFAYAAEPWFAQALHLLAQSGAYGVAVDIWVSCRVLMREGGAWGRLVSSSTRTELRELVHRAAAQTLPSTTPASACTPQGHAAMSEHPPAMECTQLCSAAMPYYSPHCQQRWTLSLRAPQTSEHSPAL